MIGDFQFVQYLRYVFLIVSIFFIVRLIRRYRKVRTISKRNCLIGIVFPVLILLVYSIIIGTSLPSNVLLLLALFGLVLGMWQGNKTKVWIENNVARSQNTVWFLMIWAISYTVTHLLVSIGHSMSMNVGIGTMCWTTAIALGAQGIIFLRLTRLKPAPQPALQKKRLATSEESKKFCSQCGTKIIPGDRFCRNCRAAVR
jgi:hypothetical protein